MSYLLGVLAFVLALLASVVLHEAGHYLPAKRFGMKVTQFFAGFGTTLWSFRRGETEYGIKALPVGGYVKIVGYTPLEEVEPGDEPRAFYRQPARQRALVIVGGVAMNAVIAFVILFAVALVLGKPVIGTATNTIDTVTTCVPRTLQDTCAAHATPRSPAALAGLRKGDRVVSFGGRQITNWNDLRDAIDAQAPGAKVRLTVERAGRPVALTATLAEVGGQSFLGVSAKVVGAGYFRQNPVDSAAYAVSTIGDTTRLLGQSLADFPAAVPKLFSPQREASPGGQVGSVVGVTEVSGQIFAMHAAVQGKVISFLELVASINIFLALLNVVPLLPMDGGHLAVLAYERSRAGVNRLRGRPDPGTVDMTKLLPLTYLVVMVLIGLGVLLILADLLNPLTIPQ